MIGALVVCAVLGAATGRIVRIWVERKKAAILRDAGVVDKEDLIARARAVTVRRTHASRPVPAPLAARMRDLPCKLGDVVTLAHGEEAWLASAVLFEEKTSSADAASAPLRTVGALFFGPERGGADRVVYARAAPDALLVWMWPVSAEDAGVAGEPPSVVELAGERFERRRRLPMSLAYAGDEMPTMGEFAVVGEYEGGAGAMLVALAGERPKVWRGRVLEPGMYDLLPGGGSAPDGENEHDRDATDEDVAEN